MTSRRRGTCAACRRDVAVTAAGRPHPHLTGRGGSACPGADRPAQPPAHVTREDRP